MINAEGKQNYLYLYDLPKDQATSTLLATHLKNKTNIVLNRIPQIRRDINRPFYTAIITIPEEDKFQTACKELRYFELVPDKPSRALPYDNDLLGSNTVKIVDHNIFVRKIPETMKPLELEEFFSKFGEIKSLKISLNSDHSSRKYGFVCFQEASSASAALESQSNADECQAIKYQPRDKRDFRKIFNNIYAKNFPPEWGETEVRGLFEQYGRIESLYFAKNDRGTYAFVCFDSDDKSDREYGPKCAEAAVNALNGASEVNGVSLVDKKLYVKEALKKRDREAERLRETIKYKSSKKRCNLYVKGFPENITEQGLRDLFSQFGEIESLKLHPTGEGVKKLYAFVCFKKPDEASTAKEKLHNQVFEGRTMTINHYEIKEIREINNEAAKDKNDFQAFRAQHNQGANWSGLANHEDIQYYLKLLLESFPTFFRPQRPMMHGNNQMGPAGQGGPRQMRGGVPHKNKPSYGNPNMRNQGGMGGMPGGMNIPGQMVGNMGGMN
jgi:RNA recognition motif-containing protein